MTPTPPTTGAGQYGPVNSSQLQDESGVVAPDALDPAYAFYSQDTYFINAVYNNLVEYDMGNGSTVVPVLASYYGIANGGCTDWFHLRSGVTFSNGDAFNAYAQWFSIVRTQVVNGPSGISVSNWNLVSYNNTKGGQHGSGSFEYNTAGFQTPWGLRQAIQAATGLQTAADTSAAANLAESVLLNMLDHFNPANATQDAIMSYPNQAFVATNATLFVANYLRSLGPLGPQWWAGFSGQQPVDPAYVDGPACSGVQANTLCATYDAQGGIGTGPYYIFNVGASMLPIVLKENTHYFASGAAGVPEVARPASIPVVIYSGYNTDSQAIGDFGHNVAGLSAEAALNFGQMYGGLPANVKSTFAFRQVLLGIGGYDFSLFGQFNQHNFPTNNTDFRKASADAINYTALNQPNLYNGTYYAAEYAGPMTNSYAPYDLGCDVSPPSPLLVGPCYPLPSQDLTAAWNLFNAFGFQTKTFMVVPATFTLSNGTQVKAGTILGDKCGTCNQLQPIRLYYTVPLTASVEVTLTVIQNGLGLFGVDAVPYGTTSAEFSLIDGSPSTFPPIQLIGWGSDFNDPFYAQLFPTIGYPSPYNGWFTNSTVIAEAIQCTFPATQAAITTCINALYKMTAENQIFWYTPVPSTNYFFVQPYLKGVVDNQFCGVFYNLMYYVPQNV